MLDGGRLGGDLVIDPVATRILGYWRWEQPGAFFGVPLTNFAGWLAVSAILLVLAGPPAKSSRLVAGIGASVAIFIARSRSRSATPVPVQVRHARQAAACDGVTSSSVPT